MDESQTYTTAIGNHEVNGLAAAVLTGAGACASPSAEHLPDASGESGHYTVILSALYPKLAPRTFGSTYRRAGRR